MPELGLIFVTIIVVIISIIIITVIIIIINITITVCMSVIIALPWESITPLCQRSGWTHAWVHIA